MTLGPEHISFNYSDVFFCYHSVKSRVFDKFMNFHYLIYIYSGEMLITQNKKTTVIRKGECVFLHRDQRILVVKQPSSNGEEYRGVFLVFRRNFLKSKMGILADYASDFFENSKLDVQPIMQVPLKPNLKSLFLSLQPYFEFNAKPTPELMELKLYEGLLALLQTDKVFYKYLFNFHQSYKIDIEEFMNENYMCDMSLNQFAHSTGRSLTSFKRDFRKISALPPEKWLINKRLEEAYNLIINHHKKASDVYLQVGFKSLAHFSRTFKKKYGINSSQIPIK